MRERTVERTLCDAARAAGGIAIKLGGYAGIPDRLCLLPGGRTLFVELKRPGEAPRRNQVLWVARLRCLGFEAVIIDNPDAAQNIVEGVMNA